MFDFDTAAAVAVYFLLGVGAARLAASAVHKRFDLVVLLFWPVMLLLAAIVSHPDGDYDDAS